MSDIFLGVDNDCVSAVVPRIISTDFDITENREKQDLRTDRNLHSRKLPEFYKNYSVYVKSDNGKSMCGAGKLITSYDTTIIYFLGSLEIMQCVVPFRVLDYDPLLFDIHWITLKGEILAPSIVLTINIFGANSCRIRKLGC